MPDSRRFDDPSYVRDAMRGRFPKIHSDVGMLVREYADDAEPALDIGAATGVLAAQLLAIGRSHVYAVEASADRIAAGVKDDRITWVNQPIVDPDDVCDMGGIVESHGVTLVTARRAFAEWGFTDRAYARGRESILSPTELVHHFGMVMREAGVKYIVVEGRIPTRSPAVALPTVQHEYEALSEGGKWFSIRATRGRALLLAAKSR